MNAKHVTRCNRVDFLWVPTEFHLNSFVKSGVDPLKIVKIVQPVDLKFLDPRRSTEYLMAENSYSLPVDITNEVKEGPFKGHLRAEPSVHELQVLLRHIRSNPGKAEAKGRQAR